MDSSLAKSTPLLQMRQELGNKREFKRYHSKRYLKLGTAWRRPRGIDSRIRKKIKGTPAMPNKRFRKPSILRDILPNGFREVIIKNVNDLRALTCVNRRFCATVSRSVSAKKRIEIVNEAKLLGITLTNEKARLMEAIEE
jgi:large subunit ribosomal protein L32e